MLLKTTSPFPVPFFSVALRTLKMTHLAPVPSGQSMSERTLGTIQPCFLGRGQSGGTGSPHRDGARASRRVWAAEQGGHRDRKEGGTGGCGRGAARGLSAEMLTALGAFAPDGSYASISCYLWDRLAPDSNHRGTCRRRPRLRPRPTWVHLPHALPDAHTRAPARSHAAQAGAHDGRARPHARAFPHADSHSAGPPSCFTSLKHPRGSPRLKGDACTSPPRLRRPQSRSGPNRAHRLCYDMLQQRSPSFVAPGTGAPVRI